MAALTSLLPAAAPVAGAAPVREPPVNVPAEQALLGILLMHNTSFERVSEFLLADHFAEAVHGRIYATIQKMLERGNVATPITLKALFDNDEGLKPYGGSAYLADLADAVLSTANAGDYGQTIYDCFLRRQLIGLGEGIIQRSITPSLEEDAKTQVEIAEKHLYELITNGKLDTSFQTFTPALTKAISLAEAAYRRDGGISGIASGFTDLDRMLGGLQNSDLLILAGRPSMGKTSLATNIAFHVARHCKRQNRNEPRSPIVDGAVVGFFSLEMSAEQLAARILSEQSMVPSEKIRRGDLTQVEFDRLVQASQELSGLPLYIDDTPALSVSGLRTRARRLKRQFDLGLIIVDYLQLMRANVQGNNDNRVQEISEITRGLKALAKELNVPVIALSQLSRAVEQREDKRPQLSDLRESGSIEQDADIVMFVFREEYYKEREEPVHRQDETEQKFNERYERWHQYLAEIANIAEVIIAKQRHGPIGKIRLQFDGSTTKFSNLADPSKLPVAR